MGIDTGEITPTHRQRQLESLRNVLQGFPKGAINRNELYDHRNLRYMRDSIRQRLSDLRIEEGYSIDFNKTTKCFDWRGIEQSDQIFLL